MVCDQSLLDSAINSESANDTSIGPLVDDLNNALNNTSSALNALEDRSESIDDIAGLAAPIVYVRTSAANVAGR